MNRRKHVIVEGSIAVGKTTVVREFAQVMRCASSMETVSPGLIKLLYGDPSKYAYPFQLHTLMGRLHAAFLSTDTKRIYDSATYTELYDGSGTDTLILKNFPATSITSVKEYGTALAVGVDPVPDSYLRFQRHLRN